MGVQLCEKTFREKNKFLNGYRKQAEFVRIICQVEAQTNNKEGGRLFQSRLPAAVKARSPTVTSLVVGMMTSSDDDDRRRRRSNSATRRTL